MKLDPSSLTYFHFVFAMVLAWCAIMAADLREVLGGSLPQRANDLTGDKRAKANAVWRLVRKVVIFLALPATLQLVSLSVAAAYLEVSKYPEEVGYWAVLHYLLHAVMVLVMYLLLVHWYRIFVRPPSGY